VNAEISARRFEVKDLASIAGRRDHGLPAPGAASSTRERDGGAPIGVIRRRVSASIGVRAPKGEHSCQRNRMSYRVNEAQRHQFPGVRRRVSNGSEYNHALPVYIKKCHR
jgi:hypothetical protein